MKSALGLLALSSALLVAPLMAQTSKDHNSHHPDPASATTAAPMSEGEIRKTESAGKVTIKHGPLQNLDTLPMTMVFRVKDPAMLDQLKEGDKIKFSAEKTDGALIVTAIQPGK